MTLENVLNPKTIRERLSSEQQTELAVSLGFCLECGGKLCKKSDGETVCTKCGLVWGYEAFDDSIPFPKDGDDKDYEGCWHPGNALAFLKGLGDPALANGGGKALMRVLAKSRNATEDLGIRARLIKTLVEYEDPPQLRRVLSRISFLLTQIGKGNNWVLADYAGNLARKAVAFHLLTRRTVKTRVGDAVVAFIIEKFRLKAKPPNLKVDINDLELIRMLDKFNGKN